MDTVQDITLENFKERTGARFRMTEEQRARVVLTGFSDEQRATLASLSDIESELADFFNEKKYRKWMGKAHGLAGQWTAELELNREGAFREFVEQGGLERVRTRQPVIPLSVWVDPDLTLENFAAKVQEATGVANRKFRRLKEHFARNNSQLERDLTPAEALLDVISRKRIEFTKENQ
jgi:hypothetical protein